MADKVSIIVCTLNINIFCEACDTDESKVNQNIYNDEIRLSEASKYYLGTGRSRAEIVLI